MNKRALRKFPVPNRKLNLNSGVFRAEQIEYIIYTEVKNIARRRTLVIYVYDKMKALSGDFIPRWTVFQTKEEYITLCRDEKGTRWQKAKFESLCMDWRFTGKCAFYSFADEERVTNFFKIKDRKGFSSLNYAQERIFERRQREADIRNQRMIAQRMKVIGALPRDIKRFMYRETLPHYIFYDYQKNRKPIKGYCTACKHEVEIKNAKYNARGICPRCKTPITFKSRGRRGNLFNRSTAQVIQRVGENEIALRIIKAYCRFREKDVPEFGVYENARTMIRWEGNKINVLDNFYYSYIKNRITPWRRGERPVFSRHVYNYEADRCGFLYHRDLDEELRGTPWQYSALKEYYSADPTPLDVVPYLKKYLYRPMLEYLVKLRLIRLATYAVYGEIGRYLYGNRVLNEDGKNVSEVLGVGKSYLPLLQEVNPGGKLFMLIKAMLEDHIQPDKALLKWCSENGIWDKEQITVPLRFMTKHKLIRYATEQFETYRKTSYLSPGYYSMSYMLSDYVDYLSMSETLGHDMKSSFVLYPNNLKEAHDRVNDLKKAETEKAYDRKIAGMFGDLQKRYSFKKLGFMVVPPRSSKEIIREGDKLHHCVGQYVQRVIKNDCIILFIRKSNAPKTPYCTVELKNGAVVQARVQNNELPPPEVNKFIKLWEKNVLYAPDRTAA